MLKSRSIPQYQGDAADWHRFLEKVSKGSDKAHEMLSRADMAYMASLTEDPESPATLPLSKYRELLLVRFPESPPAKDAQAIFDLCRSHGWFPHGYSLPDRMLVRTTSNLWALGVRLPWTSLINDGIRHSLDNWSAAALVDCLDEPPLDYDAVKVTRGMLYLSLTWPERRFGG